MGALPKEKEERLYTYADYKEWELKEGERYELIHGVPYRMIFDEALGMSSPNERHQSILTEMLGQIYVFLRGKPCKVYAAPFDVRLFYEEDEDDDTVVQPDIVVVCDKEKRGEEGCRGAPDLVVEILSPSNTAIEMERKRRLYMEAGVREYWVIDPVNKGLAVYLFSNGPVSVKTYKNAGTVPVAVLPGLNIILEQVFAE